MSNIDFLAITASGEDKIGLVQRFTSRIVEVGCNIEESRMAVLGSQFSILMLISGPWNALSKLEDQRNQRGQLRINFHIHPPYQNPNPVCSPSMP